MSEEVKKAIVISDSSSELRITVGGCTRIDVRDSRGASTTFVTNTAARKLTELLSEALDYAELAQP